MVTAVGAAAAPATATCGDWRPQLAAGQEALLAQAAARAETLLAQALAAARCEGANATSIAQIQLWLGRSLSFQGTSRDDDALRTFADAEGEVTSSLGGGHPVLADIWMARAQLLTLRHEFTAAATNVERALGLLRTAGAPPRRLARVLLHLSDLSADLGDHARAEAEAEEAVGLLRPPGRAGSAELAAALRVWVERLAHSPDPSAPVRLLDAQAEALELERTLALAGTRQPHEPFW